MVFNAEDKLVRFPALWEHCKTPGRSRNPRDNPLGGGKLGMREPASSVLAGPNGELRNIFPRVGNVEFSECWNSQCEKISS